MLKWVGLYSRWSIKNLRIQRAARLISSTRLLRGNNFRPDSSDPKAVALYKLYRPERITPPIKGYALIKNPRYNKVGRLLFTFGHFLMHDHGEFRAWHFHSLSVTIWAFMDLYRQRLWQKSSRFTEWWREFVSSLTILPSELFPAIWWENFVVCFWIGIY